MARVGCPCCAPNKAFFSGVFFFRFVARRCLARLATVVSPGVHTAFFLALTQLWLARMTGRAPGDCWCLLPPMLCRCSTPESSHSTPDRSTSWWTREPWMPCSATTPAKIAHGEGAATEVVGLFSGHYGAAQALAASPLQR